MPVVQNATVSNVIKIGYKLTTSGCGVQSLLSKSHSLYKYDECFVWASVYTIYILIYLYTLIILFHIIYLYRRNISVVKMRYLLLQKILSIPEYIILFLQYLLSRGKNNNVCARLVQFYRTLLTFVDIRTSFQITNHFQPLKVCINKKLLAVNAAKIKKAEEHPDNYLLYSNVKNYTMILNRQNWRCFKIKLKFLLMNYTLQRSAQLLAT